MLTWKPSQNVDSLAFMLGGSTIFLIFHTKYISIQQSKRAFYYIQILLNRIIIAFIYRLQNYNLKGYKAWFI